MCGGEGKKSQTHKIVGFKISIMVIYLINNHSCEKYKIYCFEMFILTQIMAMLLSHFAQENRGKIYFPDPIFTKFSTLIFLFSKRNGYRAIESYLASDRLWLKLAGGHRDDVGRAERGGRADVGPAGRPP